MKITNFQLRKSFILVTQESRRTFFADKNPLKSSAIPSYLPIRILATHQIANGRLSVESKLNFHRIRTEREEEDRARIDVSRNGNNS